MSGLSIIRNRLAFENNFTQIPNSWARDSRIGFRAKGILLLLMSHSDGWRTSLEEIAKISSDGVSAIRTAVDQLEEFGYLTRTKVRGDNGQWINAEWVLTDPFETPSLEKPTVEKPQVEKPHAENQTLKNTNIKENQDKEYKVLEDAFTRFWEIYPRKEGKGVARLSFIKAVQKLKGDYETLLLRVRDYANDPNLPEKQFIPHPSTWLNQERWEDDTLPQRESKSATDIARDIIERSQGIGLGQREIENGH